MEDWWGDWFSDLDMNGNNNNSFLNEGQTNCFVNREEHSREQRGLCCGSEAQTHSLLKDLGFKGSSSSSNVVWPHVSSKSGNLNSEPAATTSKGTKRARSSSETEDHIISERRRRQQMAERFIALSAIIPGLKKIDKASVLGEAINYVKQLQGRIAVLEQESKKKCSKSMIINTTKRSQSQPRSAPCETNTNDYLGCSQVLPQIEARGLELEKELLIRILCEKRKGVLLKLLTLLENIHLSIVTSSVLPLGKNTLNITIIAQMGEEYNMTGDELVKNLTQDLQKLYDMPLL